MLLLNDWWFRWRPASTCQYVRINWVLTVMLSRLAFTLKTPTTTSCRVPGRCVISRHQFLDLICASRVASEKVAATRFFFFRFSAEFFDIVPSPSSTDMYTHYPSSSWTLLFYIVVLNLVVCPMLCNAWTEYKFTCVCVCLRVHHTFCQLAYRSDPSMDFYTW